MCPANDKITGFTLWGEREREIRFVITLHPLSLELLGQSASLPGKVATVLESTIIQSF